MSNLTIKQFCQLENLKTDLRLESVYQYRERMQDNLSVLEVTDIAGNLVQELIVVL